MSDPTFQGMFEDPAVIAAIGRAIRERQEACAHPQVVDLDGLGYCEICGGDVPEFPTPTTSTTAGA